MFLFLPTVDSMDYYIQHNCKSYGRKFGQQYESQLSAVRYGSFKNKKKVILKTSFYGQLNKQDIYFMAYLLYLYMPMYRCIGNKPYNYELRVI